MFLSGGELEFRLDSRLKHAGMTVFGKEISSTQQAAGELDPQRLKKPAQHCLRERSAAMLPNCLSKVSERTEERWKSLEFFRSTELVEV